MSHTARSILEAAIGIARKNGQAVRFKPDNRHLYLLKFNANEREKWPAYSTLVQHGEC